MPLIETSCKKAVFLDVDNTVFLYDQYPNTQYTGGSFARWRAFLEAFQRNHFLIGIITNKDRAYTYNGVRLTQNIPNGFPAYANKDIGFHYDTFCRRLFGYSHQDESLLDLLKAELIYFLDQGSEGTKGQAMQHAHVNYLGEQFEKKSIWLIDDTYKNKISVEAFGYSCVLVPADVYANGVHFHACSDALEDACIRFMLQTLATVGIDFNALSYELKTNITKKHFAKAAATSSHSASSVAAVMQQLNIPKAAMQAETKSDNGVEVASIQTPTPVHDVLSMQEIKLTQEDDTSADESEMTDKMLAESVFGMSVGRRMR